MIEAPQMFGCPVDVGRQCTEFVAIDDIDALRKVASRNLAEPGFDLGNRSNQRPGDGAAVFGIDRRSTCERSKLSR